MYRYRKMSTIYSELNKANFKRERTSPFKYVYMCVGQIINCNLWCGFTGNFHFVLRRRIEF